MAKAISKAIPKFGSENVAPIKHLFMRIVFALSNFSIYIMFRRLKWPKKDDRGQDGQEDPEGP